MKEEILYICILNGSHKCLAAISDKYKNIKISLTSELEEKASKNAEV